MPELKGKIVVRPIPSWTDKDGSPIGTRSTMGGGTATAITEQAENVEIAKEYLGFAKLTKQAGIDLWAELNFDPIVKTAYDAPELNQPLPYFNNEIVLNVFEELQSEIQPLYLTDLYPKAHSVYFLYLPGII